MRTPDEVSTRGERDWTFLLSWHKVVPVNTVITLIFRPLLNFDHRHIIKIIIIFLYS